MAIRRQGIEYSVYPPILIVSVTTTTIFERQGELKGKQLWKSGKSASSVVG